VTTNNVAVIGMGYVGIPLAVAAAHAGFHVSGVDISQNKITHLKSGEVIVEDVDPNDILDLISSKKLDLTTDFSVVQDSKIIIICVPTPLDRINKPDLSWVKTASESVGKYLPKGSLVILESTVMPSTTRQFIVPILEETSGIPKEELLVAFSPERIDPGNLRWKLETTPKLIAGYNQKSSDLAVEFYSKFIGEIIRCSTLEVAETAKLLENSFRFINISFINEMLIFCKKMNIDVLEVIEAANSKPYGFMPFYPGIGVGGHCIPVDPLYLVEKADQINAPSRMIKLANEINRQMPLFFVEEAVKKIGNLKGKRVLIIGVAYKPNISDVRESQVKPLILGLKDLGAEVLWHDDLVKDWLGEKSVALGPNFDLAIVATRHSYLNLSPIKNVPTIFTSGIEN
jgi:UDP-N-acetyl-D-glucosamine dehydrogenase